MANWNIHLLFKVLMVLCISMNSMAQEAIVREADHYSPNELKTGAEGIQKLKKDKK